MQLLPVELWTYIFRQLRRPDLISHSRTCSAFRTIAQAELFKNVYLDYESESILFARSLAQRPLFASLVFQLTYTVRPQAGQDMFPLFPALCPISSFSNLQSLSLCLIRIDSGLCASLQNLPRLQKIRLISCQVDPQLDAPQLQLAWGRNVTTVILIYPEGPGAGWIAVIPRTTSTLALFPHHSSSATNFSIRDLFSSLMLRCQTFEFTSLTLMNDIPSNIIELLISCPRLREITLQGYFLNDNNMSFSSLPSHSLPKLEHISGPSKYMEAFISGRRIHSVVILMSSENADNPLMALRRSLVPVTNIQLVGHTIKAEWLRDVPRPETVCFLEHYRTEGSSCNASWISDLHKMSTLHTLRITGSSVSVEQQVLVHTASAVCKSLREFVFEWQESAERLAKCYTWRWRRGLPWECYIDIQPYHTLIEM